MKKLLVTLSIVATLGFSANAQFQSNTQNDGFFSYSTPSGQYRDGTSSGNFPVLPMTGVYGDQAGNPAPVGSGLVLLAGMGLAYAMRRKNNN
ncbi:MAG: hypothetical protein IJZ06_05645 [Bacteroidales bacterium]|nr:hypothetical protein [Bacteroidales bacterium]